MAHYFVNNYPQPNGDHEVHRVGCARMPTDKSYLGNYLAVSEALMEARKDFWQSSGCVSCAREFRQTYETFGGSRSGAALRARFR
jgi:hypothetical protein